jgi:hypothetical protein
VIIIETPEPDKTSSLEITGPEEANFELWRIIKAKAEAKLRKIDGGIRYGEFLGSKIQLPTDKSKPMELDLLGTYDDGIFILELKVNRSAERNAFSELFAYSNYIAEMFALSGHRDITNVKDVQWQDRAHFFAISVNVPLEFSPRRLRAVPVEGVKSHFSIRSER